MYETYYEEYNILKEKYKIGWGNDADDDCDIVIERAGFTYTGTKYRILKNKPGLGAKQLAIICDGGNLCFGYRAGCGLIIVYTD